MPTQEDVRHARKCTIAMFAFAGVSWYAIMPVDTNASDHGWFAVFGVMDLLIAFGFLLAGPRLWAARLSPPVGVLTISAGVAVAEPLGALPLYYLWPTLVAAYLLTRRDLALTLAMACVAFGAALAVNEVPDGAGLLVSTAMATSVVGITVRGLRENRDRLVAELNRMAQTDPLTGLLNRRAFDLALTRELSRSRRTGMPVSLVEFDLDHFKQINDRHGHAAGDLVLMRFARLLAQGGRDIDVVARIGGEEFAAILPETSREGALRYAMRMLADFRAEHVVDDLTLSASAGLAQHGAELSTPDAVLTAADAALYEAKNAGRGRVAVHGGRVYPALGEVRTDEAAISSCRALEGPADLVNGHHAAEAPLPIHGEQRADAAQGL